MDEEVQVFNFVCMGCGKEGTSIGSLKIACVDCGGMMVYKKVSNA